VLAKLLELAQLRTTTTSEWFRSVLGKSQVVSLF